MRSNDIGTAREWVAKHAHETHVAHVLNRALDYAQAIESAGLCLEMTDGEDLFRFLTDDGVAEVRRTTFVSVTL